MQTEKHTLQKATATACQLTCTVHLNAFFTHPLKLLKTRILEMQIRATRWKSYLRLLYTVRGDYSEFPKSSEWIRILFFLYLICPIARNQIGDTFQPRFLQNKAVRLFNKVNMQIVEIYWAVSRFWDFFFFFFLQSPAKGTLLTYLLLLFVSTKYFCALLRHTFWSSFNARRSSSKSHSKWNVKALSLVLC